MRILFWHRPQPRKILCIFEEPTEIPENPSDRGTVGNYAGGDGGVEEEDQNYDDGVGNKNQWILWRHSCQSLRFQKSLPNCFAKSLWPDC